MSPSSRHVNPQSHELDERRFNMFAKLFATLTISLFIFTSMAHPHGSDVSMSPPNNHIFRVDDADLTGGSTEVETEERDFDLAPDTVQTP